MRALVIVLGLVVSVAAGITPGHSQGFPNKLIRIVIPFTPGGSNDVIGREIASGLQEQFNQTAVVDNKPGGGGTIAYQFVAKSPPDGYTLMIAPASFTMGPHLSRNPVYNPITEFAPVILVADVPFVLVVPSSLPVHSLKELIDLAKTSKNKLSFGSVGVGTPQHLGGEMLKISAGIDMVHVPFRGATAAIPDLLAGRIDVFIGAINSLLPLIKEGKLRAIAMAGKTRVPSLKDVPTIAEAAFPDYAVGSVVGLVAPAGTPSDVIDTLNREVGKIIATPGFHARMEKIGVDVVGSTPAAYAKFLRDDYAKWAKVVAAAGLKPQ